MMVRPALAAILSLFASAFAATGGAAVRIRIKSVITGNFAGSRSAAGLFRLADWCSCFGHPCMGCCCCSIRRVYVEQGTQAGAGGGDATDTDVCADGAAAGVVQVQVQRQPAAVVTETHTETESDTHLEQPVSGTNPGVNSLVNSPREVNHDEIDVESWTGAPFTASTSLEPVAEGGSGTDADSNDGENAGARSPPHSGGAGGLAASPASGLGLSPSDGGNRLLRSIAAQQAEETVQSMLQQAANMLTEESTEPEPRREDSRLLAVHGCSSSGRIGGGRSNENIRFSP